MMRTFAVVMIVACGVSVAALADEIVLKSGVVLEGRGTPVGDDLRVDLAGGGQMVVPRSLVVEIRRDGKPVPTSSPAPAPAPAARPAAPRAVPAPAVPPAPPRRWAAPAMPPPPAPPCAPGVVYERQGFRAPMPVTYAPPCAPPPCDPCKDPCEDPCEPCKGSLEPWFISLGLSYTQAGGNSESLSFKVDFEVKYEKDPWKWVTAGFYVYSETAGISDTNRFFVESKAERKITSCLYGFLLGSYDTNPPADLDYRVIGTLGVGTTILKGPKMELRGEIGGGVTAEQRTGLPETVDPSAYFGLDYEKEWDWGGRLVADYDFLPNLDDFDLSIMRLDVKFEVPLSACLNFRLGLRLDYQLEPKDPTTDELDWLVSAGLAVNF